MQAGPVDFEVFMSVIGGTALAAAAGFGWLTRRGDKLAAQLAQLDARLAASDHHNALRHDNGLGDLWQALEAHRTESRMATAEAVKTAGQFRERMLFDIGEIKAALARLTAQHTGAMNDG